MNSIDHFWSFTAQDLLSKLGSSATGISNNEAAERLLQQAGKKNTRSQWQKDALLLLSQFKDPLVLLLLFAAMLSMILGEYEDSAIIIVVLSMASIIGFLQQRKADRTMEKMRALVRNKATVKRDGIEQEVDFNNVVPGDIVLLNAGDLVPADCYIVESKDLHVSESVLTGESYPAEKFAGVCDATTSFTQITNAVFRGTSVINGTATALAVNTAGNTQSGKIEASLEKPVVETAFEKGIRKFGFLLMRITVVLALLILTLNLLFQKPVIDSLLFALALAVGIAPELLPVIITVTLSAGAAGMAKRKVIVKKLSAIQNLGEMNMLCCDKTGTLTQGVMKINEVVSLPGGNNTKVKQYAYLNSVFETGFSNPIDEALRNLPGMSTNGYAKKDEVPYDFIRKRLSVVAHEQGKDIMITKGAVLNIIECCTLAESNGKIVPIDEVRNEIDRIFTEFSTDGYRVLGLCCKDVTGDAVIDKDDECQMTFLGFISFFDPPKAGIVDSIKKLMQTGIGLKVITGDNRLVARHIAAQIGLQQQDIITGTDLHQMNEEALQKKVMEVDVFAEIEPMQKQQIITALQRNGNVTGYLGDGVNDVNALRAADVGISIDNAVDVAREAASLVLLENNIDVIREGVLQGRKTFLNTMKYIFVTSSANFGNMFSMAAASLLLPFLPLLPIQILLNNFLSDLPALAIASDNVDDELIQKPRKWDIQYIRRFMIVFGLQSSVFDFLTFGLLLYVFHSAPHEFRTAWFMESLLTEILILYVIRTQRFFFRSMPSKMMAVAGIFTFVAAVALPYLPFAGVFELNALPLKLLAAVIGIAMLYVLVSEISKRYLMKRL